MEFINPENPKDLGKNELSGTKKTVIDHKVAADLMIKFIAQIPMDDMEPMSKKVMILKLLNPGMTCWDISVKTGIPLLRIVYYEDAGKEIVKKYLQKMSVKEGIDKFNASEFGRTDVEALRMKPKGDITKMDLQNQVNPGDIDGLTKGT